MFGKLEVREFGDETGILEGDEREGPRGLLLFDEDGEKVLLSEFVPVTEEDVVSPEEDEEGPEPELVSDESSADVDPEGDVLV